MTSITQCCSQFSFIWIVFINFLGYLMSIAWLRQSNSGNRTKQGERYKMKNYSMLQDNKLKVKVLSY